MRRFGTMLLGVLLGVSSGVLADISQAKANNTSEDKTPCTCVFNETRMWNPEKVNWGGQTWRCSFYRMDGVCVEVETLAQADTAISTVSHREPSPSLFDLDEKQTSQQVILVDRGQFYRCTHYTPEGLCRAIDKAFDPTTTTFNKEDLQFASDDQLCSYFLAHDFRNLLSIAEFHHFSELLVAKKLWNHIDQQAMIKGEVIEGMSLCGVASLVPVSPNLLYFKNLGAHETAELSLRLESGEIIYTFKGMSLVKILSLNY